VEADRTFPLIQGAAAKAVSYGEVHRQRQDAKLSTETAEIAEVVEAVKAAGCQAVIVGNAG